MIFPNRKLPRLCGYDYGTPGAYFVTLCTHKRVYLFEMEDGVNKYFPENVNANYVGITNASVPPHQNILIHKWLKETENKFNIRVDKYVIMPNHIHLIIVIPERRVGCSLHNAMKWFKSMVTNDYINGVKSGILTPFEKKVFQKSYHDHIIRDTVDYEKIWNYIHNNVLSWEFDCFYGDG